MSNFHGVLKKNISKLNEKEFTQKVVLPLIEAVHPGEIEYTHSPIEGGRDIVSYSWDKIDRQNIICVQVKTKISYGAAAFGQLRDVAIVAKETGVILSSGTKAFPHEVWIVTSSSFTDKDRRQVEDQIIDLERKNIKIVALDELVKLILRYTPDVATLFSKYDDLNITKLVNELSIHHESRAFGLSHDKSLFDFYVPINLAPYAKYSSLALSNNLIITTESKTFTKHVVLHEVLRDLPNIVEIRNFKKCIIEWIKTNDDEICYLRFKDTYFFIENKISLPKHFTKLVEDYIQSYKEYNKRLNKLKEENRDCSAEKKLKDIIKSDALLSEIASNMESAVLECKCVLSYKNAFYNVIQKTEKAITNCPKTLTKNANKYIAAYRSFQSLERLSIFLLSRGYLKILNKDTNVENVQFRVLVKEPLNVPNLDNFILVQGPPGCGKTTFLRVLTIKLLESGAKVIFVPCSTIVQKYQSKNLSEIVTEFTAGKLTSSWESKDCILVMDGLDEAPFDLSDHILTKRKEYSKIIVSTRIAHDTKTKDVAFTVTLSPFNENERDLFFNNWFKDNTELYGIVTDLVKNHKDIDFHTRLPLVATITASLIQHGFKPTTRSEIYEYRLELLLSKWDKSRGVNRTKIDDPKAKRRFLRKLAFDVHSCSGRRRTFGIEEARESFENSLGNWGYKQSFENMMEDLIVASGVIVEEGHGIYSFGHLSFQEHLVGEYMVEKNLPYGQITNKMASDWWREPLLFYSSIKGDLRDLLEYIAQQKDGLFSYARVLDPMLKYAPFSPPGAVEVLKEIAIDIDEEQ